jgi:hypothetical protein
MTISGLLTGVKRLLGVASILGVLMATGSAYACTPGLWKNNITKHRGSAVPFGLDGTTSSLSTLISTAGIAPAPFSAGSGYTEETTLLDALTAKGGGANALLRHTAAALLNDLSEYVDYPESAVNIVGAFMSSVAPSPNYLLIESVKDTLVEFNELTCVLSQNGGLADD